MTDHELLAAISDIVDRKLKTQLQAEIRPNKDEMRDMRQEWGMKLEDMRQEWKTQLEDTRQEWRTQLQAEAQPLKMEIQDIRLYLENITDRNIQILAEIICRQQNVSLRRL